MSSPKVSVCIISYNHSKYLPETIESVLAQTYEDMEIVIVDDGSTDESLDIIKDYAAKHRKIKFFTHLGHTNQGISATCNLAIENSRGEFISVLGSDDTFYPYTVEEQLKCFENNPNAGVVCGFAQNMNENGELLGQCSGTDIWSEQNCAELMIIRNRISAPTAMVRRKCYEEVGLYNLKLVYSDHEMWLKVLLFSDWKISFINKSIAFYRRHNSNTSLNQARSVGIQRQLLVFKEIKRNFKKSNQKTKEYNLLNERIRNIKKKMFSIYLHEGKITTAAKILAQYFFENPKELFQLPRYAGKKLLGQSSTKSVKNTG